VVWRMAGRPGPDGTPVRMASLNLVGPGYFSIAGTRLLRGREIQTTDHGGEPVAVVNDVLARQIAEDGNVVGLCVPLGRQLKLGGCTRILGVVKTPRRFYLDTETEATVFRAWAEAPDAIPFGVPALIIRTRGEPAEYTAAVQSALQGLRADLPYVNVYPLADNVAGAILPFRLGATLFSLFGVLALLLSGLGLYGVLGYFVNERTPEIGIRRSLGAPARTVVSLVIRQGMMPVAFGVLLGLAVAFGGSRYLAALLFGVDARDAASFLVAVLFLVGVATLATLLPALRAARVDPMTALRSE
jgi:putative ABC transport system permease protein